MGYVKLKYGPAAMAMHWIIAALILGNFVLGWLLAGRAFGVIHFEELHGPLKLDVTQWHKSIGITVLVLSVLRLVWRLVNPPPPFSAHLAPWERLLAHLVHWLFYFFMIFMPVAGWIMVSASPRIKVFPISFWGLFNWPAWPGLASLPPDQMKAVHHLWDQIHTDWMPWLGYALIALHVAGALKHQLFDKDNELARMVPGIGAPGRKGIA
jgi:cytochrome b561